VGYQGPRRTILIADDVPANRTMLVDLLRPMGFDTLEANNGQAALDQIQARKPDLVLMDLAMPVLNGLEAMRLLRRNEATRQLPIIALSANASQEDHQQALAAGANGFMPKPFDRSVLLSHLGTQLGLTWVTEPPSSGQN